MPVDDDSSRIARALREAGEYVSRMAPSPGARELRSRLETFQRVLESWGTVNRPTPLQVDALIERVHEVKRLATDSAPTLRGRKVTE